MAEALEGGVRIEVVQRLAGHVHAGSSPYISGLFSTGSRPFTTCAPGVAVIIVALKAASLEPVA
jgi:hypothetical protein